MKLIKIVWSMLACEKCSGAGGWWEGKRWIVCQRCKGTGKVKSL